MTGEIAAVHRRNIEGNQRRQGLRVVPVIKVAPVSFQGFHGAQGVGGPFEEPAGGNIAEIVGREIGQQGKAHVGGRGPVGDHPDRMFLEIIGRQPMIFRADERSRRRPRFSGKAGAEKAFGRSSISPAGGRAAD